MRIQNRSQVDDGTLKKIVDFLVKRTDCSYMAVLYVLRSDKSYTSGRTDKRNPDKEDFPGGACPSLIRIWVRGQLDAYPVHTSVVEEVPPVRIESWEEEVLFTIAHELDHLRSVWFREFTEDQRHEAEVQAEEFAVRMLGEWRAEASARAA